MAGKPTVVVLAGANGAGKSTCAVRLIPAGTQFINADEIAKNLPLQQSGNPDMEAGRILLRTMDALAAEGQDFAIETTLASRTLALRIVRLKKQGYEFHLFFLWVPSPGLSIERVAARVRLGGHNIPEPTIRRRWAAGLHNFFTLYRPIADEWRVYRNLETEEPRLIAQGQHGKRTQVEEPQFWRRIQRQAKRLRGNNEIH
jgi:predicted ABC-type ATPase